MPHVAKEYLITRKNMKNKNYARILFVKSSFAFAAVKCNDNQTVLELLAALGTGFDCASKVRLDCDHIIQFVECSVRTSGGLDYVECVTIHGGTGD